MRENTVTAIQQLSAEQLAKGAQDNGEEIKLESQIWDSPLSRCKDALHLVVTEAIAKFNDRNAANAFATGVVNYARVDEFSALYAAMHR